MHPRFPTHDLHPGPFKEGSGNILPSLFAPYVAMVTLLGIGVPVAGLVQLSMQNQAALATSSLGVYMVQLLAQLRSENVFQNKG